MARKRVLFKPASREIWLGDRTLIMGVLNVTPDSFTDGGRYMDPDRAYARALELEEQGADIIDVGAESTRPGSQRVDEEEELRRLTPVLKRLRGKLGIPISVDTYKSSVAARACELGAEILNDPTGLTFDPQLARVATRFDAGLILNHMRGTPETWGKLAPMSDPMTTVIADLRASVSRARKDGVDGQRILVDPGLGFGKRKDENLRILAELPRLAGLECPVMVGASRKSFLGQDDTKALLAASAAAAVTAIYGGAHVLRVHDVKETVAAAQLADGVLRTVPPPPEPPPRRERPRY